MIKKSTVTVNEAFKDIMVPEVLELEEHGTWDKAERGWKDLGVSKELIEEHSLCAGCPESLAFRIILASLPEPQSTVMVGSTGCTSLAFPMVAIQNIHSLFGNQNAIATGLKRVLDVRFPDKKRDVVVLAGDGATGDIGLDMTLQSWFRQEKVTTICFDNELYGNTGGQESGLSRKGMVLKMAPGGKKFDKINIFELAKVSGCKYVAMLTTYNRQRVDATVKKAVHIARELGPTFIDIYTPCILELGLDTHQGVDEMKTSEKGGERFDFKEFITPEAEEHLKALRTQGVKV